MAKLSIEELIAAFKELSLVEVSEFVKAFEEEFDVTAAAPVAVVAGGAAGEAAARYPRARGAGFRWRQEDRSDQGSSCPDLPRPEGSKGPG